MSHEAGCARCRVLEAQIAELEARIRDLEARLKQNSSNSSRPPSSDPPGTARRSKPPTGRKPGGQPGHPGTTRPLLPPQQVDDVQEIFPPKCEECSADLPLPEIVEEGVPVRHQVTDLPQVSAQTIEYRLYALLCGTCGHLTRAQLPAGVSESAVGPRLQAVACYLAGRLHVSGRDVAEALGTLFGPKAEVAVGTVAAMQSRTSEALEAVYDEARQAAQSQPVKHADETSWRIGPKKAWLWILVTPLVAVFRVAGSRSREAFEQLAGQIQGVLVSDRYSAYANWPAEMWQVCWAHLKRDFQKLVDRGGTAAQIGEAGLEVVRQVFAVWHRFRAGPIDRAGLQGELRPIQEEMELVLAMGMENADAKTARFCEQLRAVERSLWTFARVAGVEPTNNDAERALRPAVLWRKGSFGCHSEGGARFVERILTVVQSLRRQGRDVLTYLEEAIRAHQRRMPAPSLLPPAAPAPAVA